MWDLIVSVPDHCLSFYFVFKPHIFDILTLSSFDHLTIALFHSHDAQ